MREGGISDPRAKVVAARGSRLVVEWCWRQGTSGTESEVFQVLRLRDGKIVDMQDHADRRRALKALSEAA